MADAAESESILAVARSLYQRLDVRDSPPEIVSWQDMYYGATGQPERPSFFSASDRTGRPVTPDFPLIVKNKILLKPMMKGILQPEEWRPLLASSIIYHKQLHRKNNIGSIIRFSPMLSALGVLLLLFVYHEPLQIDPVQFTVVGVFVFPAIAVFSAIWVFRYSRSIGLQADEKAAEVVGREKVMEVLRRLDAMRQHDFQMGKWSDWVGYGDLPSLEKRLKKLQKASQSTP